MVVDPQIPRATRKALTLTRAGMVAERVVRGFWPLWSVAAIWAGLWLIGYGGADGSWLRGIRAVLVLCAVVALGYGLRHFRWPREGEVRARLDARLPGRPLAALRDQPAVGDGPLWAAHQARMAEAARRAKAPRPNLQVSARDPYGLRYLAAIFLAMTLLFGSGLRVASGSSVSLGPDGVGAVSSVWEGWAEPPRYTGRPTLYLNDQGDAIRVPEGTVFSFRFYGEAGSLSLRETVSDGAAHLAGDAPRVTASQSGDVAVVGSGGRSWGVTVAPDAAPEVDINAEPEPVRGGGFSLPFTARDDFGVRSGKAEIALDLDAVDRRYGLVAEPLARAPIVLDLPMPFTGGRDEVLASLVEDLSKDVRANLPVRITLRVEDAAGQTGESAVLSTVLPGRRFFEPFAAAVAEQRRDLIWAPEANAARVAQVLRALAWGDEAQFRDLAHQHILYKIIDALEASNADGPIGEEALTQVSDQLWALALELEDGALESARARLERARARVAEAMRRGANPAEIAELMEELREATDDYMDLLASQAEPAEDGTDQPDRGQEDSREVELDEITKLMEEIESLMEQGRMEEAAILMEQLNALLDNLQFQESNDPGEGRQQMEDMGEALRDQQDLSDDAFQELQEQFRNPPDSGPQSQPGGAQPEGGPSQQGGAAQGEADRPDPADGEGSTPDLAERQRALREEIEAQRRALPGLTGEAADAARDALDEAAEAMGAAEEALREGDLPGALDQQARALDALRDAVDQFAQALDDNGEGQGAESRDGPAREGENLRPDQRDPLGRRSGMDGGDSLAEDGLSDLDSAQTRNRALTEELRRRAGELERPETERDYLERLLERY